jgi:hypothetical protein
VATGLPMLQCRVVECSGDGLRSSVVNKSSGVLLFVSTASQAQMKLNSAKSES